MSTTFDEIFPKVMSILDTFNGENHNDIRCKIITCINNVSMKMFMFYFINLERLMYSMLIVNIFYPEKKTNEFRRVRIVHPEYKYDIYVKNVLRRQNGRIFRGSCVTLDERRLIEIVKSIAYESNLKNIDYVVWIFNVVKYLEKYQSSLSVLCGRCGNNNARLQRCSVDKNCECVCSMCEECYNDVQCLLTK